MSRGDKTLPILADARKLAYSPETVDRAIDVILKSGEQLDELYRELKPETKEALKPYYAARTMNATRTEQNYEPEVSV